MLLNQRLGLIMIIASLLVMGSTVYILFDSQRAAKEELARTQGLGLARLLGGMSWQELIPQKNRKGILDALYEGQSNPDFAYAGVVDLDGKLKSEVTAAGVIIPSAAVSAQPSEWLGQRVLPAKKANQSFIESHAPVFAAGQLKGFVRLGYFKPELSFSYQQMPVMAMVTLPIFLLIPLFYFIIRQDMKPLRDINQSIEKLVSSGGLQQVELQPGARLSDFMERFTMFIDAAQDRIETLNHEQSNLVLSGKMLTYKNNRVDAILQNLPDAILVIDETGEVSYVNDKLTVLFAKPREELVEKNVREWCDDSELLQFLVSSANSSGLSTLQETLSLSFQGKAARSMEVSTYPLFSPTDGSKILGRLVVFRDVTESDNSAQRQSEFVAHIAHELKTPLNVLSMYSESLLDEGLNNAEYRIEAVNVIHDEVERLSTLINNLLAINQYELGGVLIERNLVRIHDLLDDAFNNVKKSSADKSLEFKLDLPREISSVSVDKDMLRIAINNLLTNAIKYSNADGTIVLAAVETDEKIEISVSDEGYGISEQDQLNIFDKFFRSNADNVRQKTGHGLGLSLANQIVQMHHGKMTLTSELGKGSRFTIVLDKFKPQMAEAASA